jgi:two-component system CheB/CheR fusion protein
VSDIGLPPRSAWVRTHPGIGDHYRRYASGGIFCVPPSRRLGLEAYNEQHRPETTDSRRRRSRRGARHAGTSEEQRDLWRTEKRENRRPPPAQRARKAKAKAQERSDPVLPAVNPVVDDHLAPRESLSFPIVAIGASAGGLEAIMALLNALPVDTGMAFVVVQHLSPTYQSVLSQILHRATTMPVTEVTDNTAVAPNHVYVIPPGKNLVFSDGHLQLAPRTERLGQHRPIDHFMRSLAEEHGHKSIGVVLSGTANDGSLGIQEIKAAGGITFAQDSSAEQQSMPRSAVATGAVDFVQSPAEIGHELEWIARHPYVSPAIDEGGLSLDEPAMARVLAILRQSTGVDFANYKRNTLNRRIARRLLLLKMPRLEDYVPVLQENPKEVDALFQDVLINVTSFFRNPEAYDAIKGTVFPRLLEDRSRGEPIRIWALGCSTGEEAYSLAMAFTEFCEQRGKAVEAQIFASDLNGVGIDKARAGIYAKGIVQDVSPERLRRFFVEIDGSYRIAKPIRDMCVFARQNILADPPFSRLDLVACRNMLIYFEPNSQRRLIRCSITRSAIPVISGWAHRRRSVRIASCSSRSMRSTGSMRKSRHTVQPFVPSMSRSGGTRNGNSAGLRPISARRQRWIRSERPIGCCSACTLRLRSS